MPTYTEQVHTLLRTADRLPVCASRLATLEEAVRLADLHQDVDLGLEARQPLMAVARNLLRGDILTTAFVWCLAQYDREPQRFQGSDLFIQYRWVLGQLTNLYTISRAKLEEMLADLGRRLELAGFSPRHMYYTQQHIAPDLGDPKLASAALRALRRLPPDALSSDRDWELGEEIETEVFVGHTRRAIQLATPFLNDRSYHIGKSDQICGTLLVPLWQRNRRSEATALQTRCMRSYHPEQVYYWWFGELMKFPALTNDLPRAVQRYAECQRAMTEYTDPLTRLHFALDALVVFDRLHAAGKEELALRLPGNVPVSSNNGRYSVASLRDWLRREASELADLFDTRNGNSWFREQFAQRERLGA